MEQQTLEKEREKKKSDQINVTNTINAVDGAIRQLDGRLQNNTNQVKAVEGNIQQNSQSINQCNNQLTQVTNQQKQAKTQLV